MVLCSVLKGEVMARHHLARLIEAGVFDDTPANRGIIEKWEQDLQLMANMKGDLIVAQAVETIIAIWKRGRLKTLSSPRKLVQQIIARNDFSLPTNDPPGDDGEHEDSGLVRGRRL